MQCLDTLYTFPAFHFAQHLTAVYQFPLSVSQHTVMRNIVYSPVYSKTLAALISTYSLHLTLFSAVLPVSLVSLSVFLYTCCLCVLIPQHLGSV